MKKTIISTMCLAMLFSIMHPLSIHANETSPISTYSYTGDPDTPVTDINKPVVESIEFPANGTTVQAESTLPIYVKAYDADSGIAEVSVSVSYQMDESGFSENDTFTLPYNEENKRYEGNILVRNITNPNVSISNVRAVDKAGNFGDGNVRDENYKNIFTFKVVGGEEDKEITLDASSIDFPQNTKTLNHKERLQFSITLPKEITDQYQNIQEIKAVFKHSNGYDRDFFLQHEENNKFTSNEELSYYIDPGKYVLENVKLKTQDGKNVNIVIKDNESFWFKLTEKSDKVGPIITSVEMDKKGEFVKGGDKITIKVKAMDNSSINIEGNNYIIFSPSVDIAGGSLRAELDYHSDSDTFIGEIVVPNGLYPCEWYLSRVTLFDTFDNQSEEYRVLNGVNTYYFKMKNDDTFVNPTYDVTVGAYALSEKGNYVKVDEWNSKNIERRTTLKDAGYIFPNGSTTYENLVFTGWADSYGNVIDENSEMLQSYSFIYATYDKIVMPHVYEYPTSDMSYGNIRENILITPGTTYKEVLEGFKDVSVDSLYEGVEFAGWVSSFDNSYQIALDSKVTFNTNTTLYTKANYKDKKVVRVHSYYYDENAHYGDKNKMLIVDNGTTYEDVVKEVSATTPISYEGLRFKKWNRLYGNLNIGEITKDYADIGMDAIYENHIVRFMLRPQSQTRSTRSIIGAGAAGDDSRFDIFAVVVEPEGMLKLPDFKGYSNIQWDGAKPENNLIINDNINFYGVGIKDEKPVNPSEPSQPTEPEKPEELPEPETPSDNPEDNSISKLPEEQIISEINTAHSGDNVRIEMDTAKTVSKEIFAAAKGKDINIEIIMNGYTWSINGKDILADELKDINLEVQFNTSAIPSKTITELAGDNPIKQLSLTHNGDFGFKAKLSFNMGSEYKGKYGNLFYHDSDGKLVFMNAGKIDENGNVALTFSHASDYVIVINEESMEKTHGNAIKATGNKNESAGYMLMISFIIVIGATYDKKKRGKLIK